MKLILPSKHILGTYSYYLLLLNNNNKNSTWNKLTKYSKMCSENTLIKYSYNIVEYAY